MREGGERFPAAPPKSAAGTGRISSGRGTAPGRSTAIGGRSRPRCDRRHRAEDCSRKRCRAAMMPAARSRPRNAHAKWGPASLPTPTIRFRSRTALRVIALRRSCDPRPPRGVAAGAGSIRRWFGRPPFGGRPHLESPSSSCPSLCRSSRSSEAMDCISVRSGPPQLVGIAAFRDRVPVNILVGSARFRPAGLATTLWVPAIRRLCRPIIESCHEPAGPPTENARKSPANPPRLWISPALATSGFAAAFL